MASSKLLNGRLARAEIGCGMGGFITALAEADPDAVFLAVERDPNVAIRGMERVREMGLSNVRFYLGDAVRLSEVLEPGTVGALYLNFSDPWPRRGNAHRRLTHHTYLRLYSSLLAPGGTLTLKTDNESLFRFTEGELVAEGWHVISCEEDYPDGPDNICTEYETRFRESGRPIYRITAQTDMAEHR